MGAEKQQTEGDCAKGQNQDGRQDAEEGPFGALGLKIAAQRWELPSAAAGREGDGSPKAIGNGALCGARFVTRTIEVLVMVLVVGGDPRPQGKAVEESEPMAVEAIEAGALEDAAMVVIVRQHAGGKSDVDGEWQEPECGCGPARGKRQRQWEETEGPKECAPVL